MLHVGLRLPVPYEQHFGLGRVRVAVPVDVAHVVVDGELRPTRVDGELAHGGVGHQAHWRWSSHAELSGDEREQRQSVADDEGASVFAEPAHEILQPFLEPGGDLRHALAPTQGDIVAVEQPPQLVGIACLDLGVGQPLPLTDVGLAPASVGHHLIAHRPRGGNGPLQVGGHHDVEAVITEPGGEIPHLGEAALGEWSVRRPLPAPLGVVNGLGVANEGDGGWHCVPAPRLRVDQVPRLEACPLCAVLP